MKKSNKEVRLVSNVSKEFTKEYPYPTTFFDERGKNCLARYEFSNSGEVIEQSRNVVRITKPLTLFSDFRVSLKSKTVLSPLGRGRKFGFTLAEVLITLGIIGVVAAVTMPVLITNYQKHVTVTQLKKAYTDFAQAMQKAESDHGLMETWNFADFDTAQDRATYFGENYLFPYIKTIKKCIPTSNECWADNVMALGTSTANSLVNSDNAHVSFVTASGYSGYYWLHASGTGLAYWVDLNGKKGPNRVGKDIFYFQANWGNTGYKQGCYPVGAHEKTSYTREQLLSGLGLSNNRLACKKSTSYYNGYVCSALIMLDGWKIEKDYPW